MPSSATITSYYSFATLTTIRSSEVNTNFSNYRGHIVPIDPSTATAAATMTYDLGSIDHMWRGNYAQYGIMYANTSGSAPTVPTTTAYALYFKSDGNIYKKNSAGTETQVDSSAPALPTIQRFTSGSGTYTTPANCRYIRVRAVGGGAGSGGSGTAGGGNGGAGGNTTFGSSLLTANGGTGAGSVAGGAATVSSPAIGSPFTGGSGGNNSYFSNVTGGSGGNSMFGGGGAAGTPGGVGVAGVTNTGGGAGGAGAASPSLYGGIGGGAGGSLDAIITSPSATYSYAVGAGGTAGTAGSGGSVGAVGGSGYIEVTEYY